MAEAALPSGRMESDIKNSHFENLTSKIDEDKLPVYADHLLKVWAEDKNNRKEWLEMADMGLKVMAPDGGVRGDTKNDAMKGLTNIKSPALIQAQTQFASAMHSEMIPLDGPVKIKEEGPAVQSVPEDAAEKLRKWMNHVLIDTTKYNRVLDRMLHILPLTGQVVHRITNDPIEKRPKFTTVMPGDFTVNPEAMTIEDASRICWCYDMSLNEFNQHVKVGWFDELKNPGYLDADLDDAESEGTGVKDTASNIKMKNDMTIKLLEVHVNMGFDGIDGMGDDDENKTKVVPPYIVTLDTGSKQIVSIRRNWNMNDPLKKKIEHFVDYQFYPTSKFYSIGLYHICGGMHRLATGLTRSSIDWAYIRNMPGGFYLQGALAEGVSPETTTMETGKYVPLNAAAAQDIRQVLMPNPVPPADNTMLEMLDYAIETIKQVAGINDVDMGSVSAQTPAATTAMMVQRAEQRAKGIQKRLWDSQTRELAIVKRIMLENVEMDVSLPIDGEIISIARGEIDGVTFIPTADPASSSKRERAANIAALLELNAALPGQLDPAALAEKAIRNYDMEPAEVMLNEQELPSYDPLTENARILRGEPVATEITDDHESHITVLLQLVENPTTLAAVQQMELLPLVHNHLWEHWEHWIKAQIIQIMMMETGQQVPLQIWYEEMMTSEQKNWLAKATASVMAMQPDIGRIPGVEAMSQDPMMQAQLEHQQQMMELERQGKEEEIEGKRQELAVKSEELRLKIQDKMSSANISERINAEKLDQIRRISATQVTEAVRKAEIAAKDREDELAAKVAERDLRIEEAEIRIQELEAKLQAERARIRLIPNRGGE